MIFRSLAVVGVFATQVAFAQVGKPADSAKPGSVINNNVTEAEIRSAQEGWGKALIQISSDFQSGGLKKARKTAADILDSAYGYNMGNVLFKPTLTHGETTFRVTKDAALSYFVGGNKDYPMDTGFALKGWKKYEFTNAGVYINGDLAITMGKVYLTDKNDQLTIVDKTWGFKRDNNGKLRIILHHSSLPYSPPPGVVK